MDAHKMEFRNLTNAFHQALQVVGKSPATISFYIGNLNRIRWWLESNQLATEVSQIDPQIIRALLLYVKNTPNRWQVGSTSSRKPGSMAAVDAYWRTFQAFFSWLVKEGLIAENANPLKKIPRPKSPRKLISDIPLPLVKKASENVGKNDFLKARNKAIILVFLDTGVRLGGCHSMNLPNINLETGIGRVWEKGGQQVTIHLGTTTRMALKEYLAVRAKFSNPALWLKENGSPLCKLSIQTMIRRLKKFGNNERWTPHTFRNTWAVALIRNGADTFSLQTLGGWKDLEMPRRYTQALKIEDAIRVHCKTSPADRMAEGTNT